MNDKEIKTDDIIILDDVEFPIEVAEIKYLGDLFTHLNRNKPGQMVMIRPVADEYNNKTFLGVYLGDLPSHSMYAYNKSQKCLIVMQRTNPAIFVFKLEKVIWGYESWWGPIKSEEQLREITDEDIQNIWYVKLLREGFQSEKPPEKPPDKGGER